MHTSTRYCARLMVDRTSAVTTNATTAIDSSTQYSFLRAAPQ